MKIAASIVGLALLVGAQTTARQPGVRFDRVYPLKPDEGVFAYARVSPSGQLLAYASEMPAGRRVTQTVTVVDLRTGQTQFTEPGIDAYWSNDERRMIFLSMLNPAQHSVVIRHTDTGAITREVAPVSLGDYFSWSVRDGRDLILTIQSHYYNLDGDRGVLPAGTVAACDGIGTGDRPLISKDGRRVTTFVRGAVVVRNLTDCQDVLNTGIQGAKADFSWDGRYVAFHTARKDSKTYEIAIVDTARHTVRTVSGLPGSSLFPSWTRDGRLCFRYDGDDYRGFMIASNVLSEPERPLPAARPALVPAAPAWEALFPETPRPAHKLNVVLIWSSWSAHGPMALAALQQADAYFRSHGVDAGAVTALELSSRRADVDRLRRQESITLPEIPLAPDRLAFTEALNQIPTTLLFRDGVQIDRRLGAQTYEQLKEWIASEGTPSAAPGASGRPSLPPYRR